LLEILDHKNIDICVEAVSLLNELTDEDVVLEECVEELKKNEIMTMIIRVGN